MPLDLDNELRPYLDGIILRHPLVQYDHAYPAMFGRQNRLYRHRMAVQAGQYIQNEWDLLYPHLHPGDRLQHYVIETYSDEVSYEEWLTPQRLKLFGQDWTAPENLYHISSNFWAMAGIERLDVSAVMDDTELEYWKFLPEVIPVYRAHLVWNTTGGYCWYPDRSTAFDWAVGMPDHVLSAGVVDRQDVRAVFKRRGETEFIVKPEAVDNFTTTKVP